MRLGEINPSSLRPAGRVEAPTEPDAPAAASESRALVALAPAADQSEHQIGYRNAPFLAHLIATKDQHPQTRERRRAEPDQVLAAYCATAKLTGH